MNKAKLTSIPPTPRIAGMKKSEAETGYSSEGGIGAHPCGYSRGRATIEAEIDTSLET